MAEFKVRATLTLMVSVRKLQFSLFGMLGSQLRQQAQFVKLLEAKVLAIRVVVNLNSVKDQLLQSGLNSSPKNPEHGW
jgi:hypothetical protein